MMLVKLDNRGGKGRNWFVAVWTCFGGLFWFYNDFGYSGFFTHWVLTVIIHRWENVWWNECGLMV